MAISFSGLASGLDTGSLIDQLVAVEESRASPLVTKQQNLTTQKSIISSLASAVGALGTVMKGMDTASEVSPKKGTASDTRIAVTTSATATPATYDTRVKQLAQAQSTVSQGFATNTAGAAGAGGLGITVNGTTKNVTWTASDSLDAIATKINDAKAGVTASVLFDGSQYRIVTQSTATGTAAKPTFVDSGSGLDLSNAANIKQEAKDAILTINGLDVSRPTNVMSDVISGVTLTLGSVPAASEPNTKITVAQDSEALTTKVQDFVKAYNAINSALHVQLDYTGTTKGANTLFGDSTLRQLQQQLGNIASSAFGGMNLAQIGVTRDKTGAMTLDTSKLNTALTADASVVDKLFVQGGFSTAVSKLTENYTKATTGLFAVKSQAFTDRSKILQTQIDRIYTSADNLKSRLESQFSALENAMSTLKSQSSQLTAMLG